MEKDSFNINKIGMTTSSSYEWYVTLHTVSTWDKINFKNLYHRVVLYGVWRKKSWKKPLKSFVLIDKWTAPKDWRDGVQLS